MTEKQDRFSHAMEQCRQAYRDIPTPPELEGAVEDAIQAGCRPRLPRRGLKRAAAAAAGLCASFVVTKTESLASAYFRQYFYNLDLETGQSLTLRDVLGPNWAAQGEAAVEEQLEQWDEEQRALLFDRVDLEELLEEKEDFYLQEDGTVVVVFDKYEIAAGAAGVLEFPIGKLPQA